MVITARTGNDYFPTDLTMDIFCKGPGGKPLGDKDYFTAGDAYLKPGTPCILKTGAGGHSSVIKPGTDSALVFGFVGFDPKLVATFDTAYPAGAKIPVYPIDENIGCTFRNIRMDNPAANVNANTPLCVVEGTNQGKVKVATEATLTTGHATFASGATSGANGANGATIHSRIVGRTKYYLANPAADTYITLIATRG